MPTIAELFDQAVRHHRSGALAQAEALYREVLQLNPDHAETHNNLGVALKNQGRFAHALDCFRQAIHINPSHVGAYNNLGTALFHLGRFEEALTAYRHCLHLQPDFAEAHNNLGNALLSQGQIHEATASFQKALQFRPNYVEALTNLGSALGQRARLSEAAECYQQALAIDPKNPTALWNRSLLRLQQGDYEAGWRDFPQREALPGMVPRSFQQQRWDGSPLEGKTILVYAEQRAGGLGDTLHFVRFLPLIQQRGGSVIFECQSALYNLLAGFRGIDLLIPFGTSLPHFDVQIPLIHVPAVFGVTPATLAEVHPYLAADPKLVAKWVKEIERALEEPAGLRRAARLKIGIAWQGSMNQIFDRRSLSLDHFEVLARMEGIRLISLQVGPGRKQLETAAFPVIDLGGKFDPNSLDDLAATMMNLDLVVTVDTAVPHLAGALGVPVWTMLQFAPDWRWLLERSDCPWYPTMRLFRQDRLDDWQGVFVSVVAEIRKL